MTARPLYETASNLADERRALDRYCAAKGLTMRKLKLSYAVDCALFGRDQRLRSLVEYKRRDGIEHYPTAMLSAEKVWKGRALARELGVSFIFLTESEGVLRYCNLSQADVTDVRWGGRKDRNDWQDMELVCHFPRELFQELRV